MIDVTRKHQGRLLFGIFVAAVTVAGMARGEMLETRYQEALTTLRAELAQAVPVVDEQKKAAYLAACEAEQAAKVALALAQQNLGEVTKAQGAANHAKGKWIGGADRGIAKAQAMLEQATTDAERKAAQEELVKWQENRKAGLEALKERQVALDKAKLEEPKWVQQSEAAGKALELATANLLKAVNDLDLGTVLGSDKLDGKLAKVVVLVEATPAGLAAFARQGNEQEKLVEQLLADEALMVRMLTAGGAKEGKYGEAMKIYSDIQKASERACEPGILQNLALGISLEMVVPYRQKYSTFMSRNLPAVDPVERYRHYEKAYLAGELDPAFKEMTAWECRWIAGDPAANEDLAWLRTMMRNYRPDLIAHSDPRWYYTRIIKTDVAYRRHPWDDSLPVSRIQQAMDRGGICHVRAWVARSTARAFGIPALRVEQGGAKSPVAK